MVIKRKTYSEPRRDPLPEPFSIPDELAGKYDKIEIRVSETKQYNKDMAVLGSIDKATVRQFRKDLKDGFLYTDGPKGGDTHYLADKSGPTRQRFTKSINVSDRFDYIIYPYELDEKNRVVSLPVVIQSLIGHTIYGQGTYSETR